MPPLDPDLFRQIVESLPVGLYIVAPDRRIVLWNQAAEHITGFLAQEVIGRSCCDGLLAHCGALGTQLCAGTGCVLTRALRDRQPVEAFLFARHKDGRRVPVHVKSMPLYDSHGEICAIAEAFEPQGSGPELRPVQDPVLDSNDGLTIPSVAATETYLQSRLEAAGTSAIYVVAVGNMRELARQRGLEMVHAAMRALVHTVADLLPMPHFLGRWHDQALLMLVPNLTDQLFSELLAQLRNISNTLTVLWWGDRVTASVTVRGAMVRDHTAMRDLLTRLESRAVEEDN
jgi:PAS domain S-box-containing protein